MTVSESREPKHTERIKQCVLEFVEAKRDRLGDYSIGNTEAVLRARLFGLGLRGEDLRTEISLAKMERYEREESLKCNMRSSS
jgi:hypothetical protein